MSAGLVWNNLVTYSLQIGLLVGLAGFAPALLRLRLPGAKLAYWQILLAACLLLPLVRPWRQQAIASIDVSVSTAVVVSAPVRPSAAHRIPGSEIAILLLAAGTAVRLAWLGVGFWRLRRYRLNSRPLGSAVGSPALLLSDQIASPVTFGWYRPVVLLPSRFTGLGRATQDAILCHEMLHVKRRDWLFTVTEEVVRAVFWFHPAIWWLLGEIQLAREQAVDKLVIERTRARDEYVDALLAIAGAQPQLDLALAPLFLRKRHLTQRVVSIFKEVGMTKTTLISRLALGLGLLAAACWFVTGALPLAAAPQLVNDAAGVTVDIGAAALLHRAPVSYPESARKMGVQGTVMVEATLDGSGNVADARVLSGPDELRKAALQSVLQWHFHDAAVGAKRMVSITFQPPAVQNQPSPEVLAALRNTYGGGQRPQAANLAEAEAQYKEFLRLNPQASQPKQISPELQAKLAEARAQQPNVEQYIGQLRSDSSTGSHTLKSITVLGLADQVRDELLSRLPVHEGDILTDQSHAKVVAAVREFDEHLTVRRTLLPSGEVRITITAPSYSPAAELAGPGSIKVGGAVMQAKLVSQPRPIYPLDAKEARLQGVVKLAAVIAKDGTIKNLDVISGDPLLAASALEAVKQWRYETTLLNGDPVEVSTQIDVNYTLQQ